MTQLNLFPDPEPLCCLFVDGPLKGEFHTIERWPYRVPVRTPSPSHAAWSSAPFPTAELSFKTVEYFPRQWYAYCRDNDPLAPRRTRYMDFAASEPYSPDYALNMLDALIIQFGKDAPSE